MKKRPLLLLLWSPAMLLAVCGCNPNDGNDSGKTSDPSDQSGQSSLTSGSHESGFNPSGDSSSESVSIDYTIGWSQDILDVMEPHLGGNAIPFIDLPGQILATWVPASSYSYYYDTQDEEAHLSIISTGAFDAALAGKAKMTYQLAGWDVQFDTATYTMRAEEPNLGMIVDFYGEEDTSAHMICPVIDVFYDEPFAAPTNGKWRTATLEALESIGIQAPHALPYCYLGTMAEEATVLHDDALEIKGRDQGWDQYKSKILNAARKAFPASKKWSETTASITVEDDDYYYTPTYTTYTGTAFSKDFNDGYTVTAFLYGRGGSSSYYYGTTYNTPYLYVTVSYL